MQKRHVSKLAVFLLTGFGLALCACGTSPNTSTTTNTKTSGNWEAKLTGGTEQASLLDFVTSFSVINNGPLSFTDFGLSFINAGACFGTGANAENQSGNASFTTSSTGAVTGTLSLTVNSVNPAGNVLTLTGNLTGTSNGTTTTTGTLTNGVVVGNWNLTGGHGDPSCTGSGNFVMCQGKATCTPP